MTSCFCFRHTFNPCPPSGRVWCLKRSTHVAPLRFAIPTSVSQTEPSNRTHLPCYAHTPLCLRQQKQDIFPNIYRSFSGSCGNRNPQSTDRLGAAVISTAKMYMVNTPQLQYLLRNVRLSIFQAGLIAQRLELHAEVARGVQSLRWHVVCIGGLILALRLVRYMNGCVHTMDMPENQNRGTRYMNVEQSRIHEKQSAKRIASERQKRKAEDEIKMHHPKNW